MAAHPDDEVLSTGGTMALLAAAGARLRLVAVTDGEASHPGADPAGIARVRTAESAAALGILGVRDIEVIRLRLPDTGLAACEDELAIILREQCAGSICAWRPGKQTLTGITRPRAGRRGGRPGRLARTC